MIELKTKDRKKLKKIIQLVLLDEFMWAGMDSEPHQDLEAAKSMTEAILKEILK